jgi:hypothetical protein
MINHSTNIERDLRTFIQQWIRLLADNQIEAANQKLDRDAGYETYWTAQKIIDTIKEIYNPSTRYRRQNNDKLAITPSNDRDDAIQISAYSDGSGYWADCDLYLNNERSDIVIQFEFKNTPRGYLALVHDVHVL